jgi:hypothetical protein
MKVSRFSGAAAFVLAGECKTIGPFQTFWYIYKQQNGRDMPDGKNCKVYVYEGRDCTGESVSPPGDATSTLGRCYPIVNGKGPSVSVNC